MGQRCASILDPEPSSSLIGAHVSLPCAIPILMFLCTPNVVVVFGFGVCRPVLIVRLVAPNCSRETTLGQETYGEDPTLTGTLAAVQNSGLGRDFNFGRLPCGAIRRARCD